MKKLKISAHDEYWEARAREIFEYVDRKDIDFFAELEKTYRNEAVRLQKSLFDFTQSTLKITNSLTKTQRSAFEVRI